MSGNDKILRTVFHQSVPWTEAIFFFTLFLFPDIREFEASRCDEEEIEVVW